jgi:hypothetical protein
VSTLTLAPLVLGRAQGEPTLDDLLAGVWEGLSVRRAVRCPVCTGEMEPAETADREFAGGRCGECGATLG